jgi:hypothetical protein
MENKINLSISDLLELRQIISVACERGAFRAEEMSSVGKSFDKLSTWLVQNTQAPENDQSQQGEENVS